VVGVDNELTGRKKQMTKGQIWRLTYKSGSEKMEQVFYTKKNMIEMYLKLLGLGWAVGLSELKVLKNGKDYTETLNKFLE